MKKNLFRLPGLFLCFAIFAAASNAADRTITTDTTWASGTGPYTQTNLLIRNATLTIEPGVIVTFNDGGLLKVQVGGRVMASGATFTWTDGANEWRGIEFVEGDSRSKLENCTIEHASGYPSTGINAMVFVGGTGATTYPTPVIAGCTIGNGTALRGIHVSSSCPQIINNIITGFSAYGIYVGGSDASAPLIAGNLITLNDRGIGVFNGASGIYRANRVQGNMSYGFYNGNTGATEIVDARYNWWGDPSGPQPTGIGDRASSKIDYSPWAASITDSDADGMWDTWEVEQFESIAVAGVSSDTDVDGLLDKDEFLYGTDPNDRDSDGDGVWDGREVQAGMNPTLPGDFGADEDGDGYSNLRELISGTDPWDDASIPATLADGEPPASGDGDVDGSDLAAFIAELGSTACPSCKYDLDADGDVDSADLFLFSEDFGRTAR